MVNTANNSCCKHLVKKTLIHVILCLFLIGCNNSDQEKVNITLKVVDSETEKVRIKDRVEIRVGKFGFPTRRFVEIGQYYTDSSGIVKLNLIKNERYRFSTYGEHNASGDDEFYKGELKNNQEIVIEVIPPEKNKFNLENQ